MPSLRTRFGIETGETEARRRFVNRATNFIEGYITPLSPEDTDIALRLIADAVGMKFKGNSYVVNAYIEDDFIKALEALEALFTYAAQAGGSYGAYVDNKIQGLLSRSESDIGVRWSKGEFTKAGAAELDSEVIAGLAWLEQTNLAAVRDALSKSLRHLMQSVGDASLRSDAVTDAYEALESLAKIVTGRQKDLSANREQFVSVLAEYSQLGPLVNATMREYITLANKYRHGPGESARAALSEGDAEGFVYLTTTLIRVIQAAGALDGRPDPTIEALNS